ncbi:type VII secretion-associated serine protease mycosin [Streptomyces flavofungini]|uniref:type VII secretion-associated serine protease mycosin n=1 Tax=Streptomyces flavofungini TaxID=68200 RepID=UPI0025AFE8B9|nr:type VII secretion-associated serine protease mycosin [Streptomyces flavofungini]WJV45818.1 type VII secretion-associated serine protease mycosin [Streptomyces flavofungini]
MTYARRTWAAVGAALAVTATTAAPAAAAPSDRCEFPNKPYAGRPWALQRVLLDELWRQSTGKGVTVAVIDTGVDIKNRQLKPAVDVSKGRNFLPKNLKDDDGNKIKRGSEKGTSDMVGHGTRVAGIIAARPAKGTGFVGLAPDAKIIPIQQNDAEGHGTTATLADAIDYAVASGAQIINISQDTANAVRPEPKLEKAVKKAIAADRLIIASAGNDGLGGNVKETYPASFEGVLAVASSDRNNERAPFSQSGDFVDVAAPGVDMISTVPLGGHCSDNGTSFSAPYVAGVAALIKSKHPAWTPRQITAQIQQTAERSTSGFDRLVGWGVVDPVRALTEDDHPIERPIAHEGVQRGKAPSAAELHLGETEEERTARLATYVAVGAVVAVAGLGGAGVALRDARRRRGGEGGAGR